MAARTKRMRLHAMAHARSGDKGDASNVGLIAYDDAGYEIIRREVTPARVKAHFGGVVKGKVDRYEVPNLRALNFILHDALGGGGSGSLKTDAQGKTHGSGLLLMEIAVPASYAPGGKGTAGNEPPARGAARAGSAKVKAAAKPKRTKPRGKARR